MHLREINCPSWTVTDTALQSKKRLEACSNATISLHLFRLQWYHLGFIQADDAIEIIVPKHCSKQRLGPSKKGEKPRYTWKPQMHRHWLFTRPASIPAALAGFCVAGVTLFVTLTLGFCNMCGRRSTYGSGLAPWSPLAELKLAGSWQQYPWWDSLLFDTPHRHTHKSFKNHFVTHNSFTRNLPHTHTYTTFCYTHTHNAFTHIFSTWLETLFHGFGNMAGSR